MGDFADDARDAKLNSEIDFEEAWADGYLVTNDRRFLRVSEMADGHLDNTICMIERGELPGREFCLDRFKVEQARRRG